MKVIDRKNILVYNDSQGMGVSSFTFTLYCNFQPDMATITDISVTNDQLGAADQIIVSSDLVENNTLFCISNANGSFITTNFKSKHLIKQPVNRQFTFFVKYIHTPGTTVANQISFMLEFVKYEK